MNDQQQPFHGEPTLADARTATSTALLQHSTAFDGSTSKISANFPSVATKTLQTSLKKEALEEHEDDAHDATAEDDEMEDDDDDTRSSTSVIFKLIFNQFLLVNRRWTHVNRR